MGTERAGFTLIELSCVLLIIALFSVVALPMFASSLARRRVQAAAEQVAEDLNRARDYARTSSSAQTVVFDPNNDTYSISPMPQPDNPAQPWIVHLADDPYRVDLTTADFGGDTTLIYNGYGLPDSGGSVTLLVGSITRTVSIDAQSGVASIP